MSEKNGKVCCNCRHNIRTGEITNIKCHCDIDGSWLSYVTVMTHWCRHWSKEREEDNKKIMPWYLEPFKQAIETFGSNNENEGKE